MVGHSTVVCSMCGRAPEDGAAGDELPLTWVTSIENAHERVYCDRCAREHLRAIEAKLDFEWWLLPDHVPNATADSPVD